MPLMEGYPNPGLLETPAWLAEHLKDPDLRILDPRPDREYNRGHIPGAIPLEILFSGRHFKAHLSSETCSAEEFARIAGELGINATDTVISTDDSRGPSSARTWWTFARFGHTNVRYLHGGLRSWTEAGYPMTQERPRQLPTTYQLAKPRDELACTLPQAIEALGRTGVLFWDTRTKEEYVGARPIDSPPHRRGHIPTAIHLDYGDLRDSATGLFKPAEEMQRILEAAGLTPEKEIITYCTFGMRAAYAVLALKLLGYDRARSFDGSFAAWSLESDAPVQS